ncbi:MAG: hypothetical protein ACRYFS_07350 [Janthinobacterium lividum]
MESNSVFDTGTAANSISPDQEKVIRALADNDYYWRTRDRMLAVTGIAPEQLDTALTQLLQQDVVKTTFSKKHNVIFGLRERVEKK